MKLLSFPQGKSLQEHEAAAQELRIIELDGFIRAKRKELDDLDRKILFHASPQALKEEEAWKEKIRLLTEEVANLERRRTVLLVPLEAREKEADTRLEALLQREETILIKETDLSQTADALADRLDDVSEREQNTLLHEADVEARSSNLALKEAEQKKREDAVLALMKEAHAEKLAATADISRQQAVLKGRDTVLNERERVVAKKEKGFLTREKAIVDRYKTLERAIAEMKLKYGDKLIFKP